jgi:hypothetical protein
MYRFFSITVILNWVAVLAVLSVVGLGIKVEQGGMIDALNEALSSEAGLQLLPETAYALSVAAVLIVLTMATWALLAIIFAAPNGTENKQQDFVIMFAMGVCLCVFAIILAIAIYTGATFLSTTICIASFATILAGIAHRVFVIEAEGRNAAEALNEGFGLVTTPVMARQSAARPMSGRANSRFVPKRNLQPMN